MFLARLDPYKRPWLFVELARAFPDAEFVMVGQSHFSGPGSWEPPTRRDLRLAGNLSGEEKLRELDAAWVLVNSSPHEALAVSFQEALASRTPLLACVDTEGVVSRFGVSVGPVPGDGLGTRCQACAKGWRGCSATMRCASASGARGASGSAAATRPIGS